MTSCANEIREMLNADMVSHGLLFQCLRQIKGEIGMLDVRLLLEELLLSGEVEIGLTNAMPGRVEFIAWRGTVHERIDRAISLLGVAQGHDKEFAYWLALKENIDRYE